MTKYIELEALKNRFAKRLVWLKKDIHDEYSLGLYDGCEYDTKLIDEIPTADVAPVRHGEWEIVVGSNGKEYMVCTCCRVSQDLTGVFTYCPNCGAKMDGGDGNSAICSKTI